MANENIFGWGPDDKCLSTQAELSGIKNVWIDGPIYHLEHGEQGQIFSKAYGKNYEEYAKVKNMSVDQFSDYKKSWSWIPKYPR